MSSDNVYTGLWVRQADGSFMGSTLTLTSRDGAFLVAFLALFVNFVGGQSWSILKFLIHQSRAERRSEDALHHQQQAVLRNSTSAVAALWLWLRLAWAWRSQTSRPLLRSLVLVLVALLNIAAFSVAGIFSSHVNSISNRVLLQNQTCGSWRWQAVETLDAAGAMENNFDDFNALIPGWSAYYTDLLRTSRRDVTYARSCYDNTLNTLSPDCQVYITQQLPYMTNENAECPFDHALCLSPAVQVESDPVFSDIHLGINTAKADRVAYRRRLTCSVLTTDGYTSSSVTPLLPGNDRLDGESPYSKRTNFYYGPMIQPQSVTAVNFTNFYRSLPVSRITQQMGNGYEISCESSMLTNLNSFNPIRALQRSGGDIDICFLGVTTRFTKPVNDPWFSAHTPHMYKNATAWYQADKPLSPLGCATHHQFCNPSLPAGSNCTEWSNISQIPSAIKTLGYRSMQSTVQALMYEAAWNTSFDIVNTLSNEALLATTPYGVPSSTLPDNQWVLEVRNFHATMLASIQGKMLDHVTGPSNPDFLQYVDPATTPDEHTLCNSQIATRNDYASFSTFGVVMILAVGGVIIIIGLSLEYITSTVRKSTNRSTYRQLEWDTSEVLQLQRLAYEGQGTGCWKGEADAVPITARDDRFGIPVRRERGEDKDEVMETGSVTSSLITCPDSRR